MLERCLLLAELLESSLIGLVVVSNGLMRRRLELHAEIFDELVREGKGDAAATTISQLWKLTSVAEGIDMRGNKVNDVKEVHV